MFGPFLSCRPFGIASRDAEWHLRMAQSWSGQPSLHASHDGTIRWDSRTKLNVVGDTWYSEPSPIETEAKNALIPLGDFEGLRVFAFVSPFPVVVVAFRAAAARYAHIVDFDVDLNRLANEDNGIRIESIEGVTPDGNYLELAAEAQKFLKQWPKFARVSCVKTSMVGQHVKIDAHFNVEIADVSTEIAKVSRSLTDLFLASRRYLRMPTPALQ